MKKTYEQLVKEAEVRTKACRDKVRAHPDYAKHAAEWDAEYAITKAMAEARERASLTQAQLAERMGISQPVVSRAMHGNVTVSTLVKWFSACDCDLHITVTPRNTRQLTH